ncbi:MAG: response regulator [Flavobacteriales bacterium]|nr:response regulator [Flavobacteriales bacterium]
MMPIPEPIKVLYVDDEEGNLTAFRANFRREFEIRVSTSAAEGLAMLEQEPAHIVISDQRMPHMSGAQFLAAVRERWPRSIRIMLTGYSDIEAVIDAVNKGGIHAYITKPWDPLDLKLRLEQAYEMHSLRAERERMFQRYRQLFDNSGDPIVIVDSHGRFHEANSAAEKLIGHSRAELLSDKLTRFIERPESLVRAMLHARSGTAFKNVEITIRNSHDRVLDCLMTATYLGRGEDGSAMFQALIKDITDRKQEELRLKKVNSELDQRVAVRTKQLREALDDLGAFSYSVAHDLRSPLKSIRSLSDHLGELAVERNDNEMNELSGRIHQGASRLVALVDDLLSFSRTDKQDIRITTFDLREAALDCLSLLDTSERRLEITLPQPGDAIVQADASMFRVVLTNLISNALKFTRTKDPGRITINGTREGEDVVISVRDNGVGFDPEKAAQLFGVFKRLHRAEQFEGTGIGLAIVQRVVQKHGGSCWAEGSVDQGATFYLRIPFAAKELSLGLAS